MARAATALACACLAIAVVRADYRVNYRSAILAIDGQRWSEAVMYLNLALKENSTEGLEDVLITGTREEPYLPLYYLGYAYFRMGDCARATGAWQLARMSEAVDDYPKLVKTLRDGITACDKRGGAITEETAAETTVTPQRKNEIARLMKQAEGDLKAQRFKQARDRVEQARALGAAPSVVDGFLRRVTAAEPAPPGPVQQAVTEREAFVAFYSGDYARVELLLAPILESGTLSSRGHLYLACSYAASALLRGRDGEARLNRARDVYKQAMTKNPSFAADWKFISPRVREAVEGRGPS